MTSSNSRKKDAESRARDDMRDAKINGRTHNDEEDDIEDQSPKTGQVQRPKLGPVEKKRYQKKDRQRRIVTAIDSNASVSVGELAMELQVSKQTIRRDLDELNQNGVVNRLYGGAALRRVGLEPTLMERTRMATAERSIIADLAVDLFSDGEVVMLAAGVSTYYLAKKLALHLDQLQVFTNNLSAGLALATNPGIRVVFTPGDFDPKEECMCGAETLAFLDKFRADTAVVGASGLYEGGACEVHSGIAWVDRAMLQQARRHILLLDHSRFDRPHMELICTLDAIDIVVTDRMPDSELRDVLTEHDVEILCPETAGD